MIESLELQGMATSDLMVRKNLSEEVARKMTS